MTRRFSSRQIPLDVVVGWCDDARRAPSAGFSQGSHLVVLHREALESFWQVSGAHEWFERAAPGVLAAPVVVLAIAEPGAYVDRYNEPDKRRGLERADAWPIPHWLTDTAMVVENLLLLVEEAGRGALLFGVFRNHTEVLAAIGAPAGVEIVAAVAIGDRAIDDVPTGSSLRRPRRPLDEVVHLGRWGSGGGLSSTLHGSGHSTSPSSPKRQQGSTQ
jgi:nitroreductase